ncbi:unnamed protein product [Effrenium voratum]|nr:unnamed protein product [Effrenium voratum]
MLPGILKVQKGTAGTAGFPRQQQEGLVPLTPAAGFRAKDNANKADERAEADAADSKVLVPQGTGGYPPADGCEPKWPARSKADWPFDWPKEVITAVAMPAALQLPMRPVPHWRGGSKNHSISRLARARLQLCPLHRLCGAQDRGKAEYDQRRTLPKQTRVEKLLQQWQQDGGVDKALEQMVRDKQEAALVALDKAELLKQCKKRNLKPFVKEVMVDRLLKAELRAGHFAPKKVEEEKPVNGDLVEALLSSEAQRKKDAELKKQQDEADSSKRKELRVMSVEALKKALISKSLEASGRKDDMVEMLFQAWKQEQALASRKAELKALSKDDLKILAARNGSTASAKEAMIEAVLQQEAKQRQMQKDYDAKVILVLVKKREELDDKTNHELKERCASRGLKAGSCKEDRVERLLENMRTTHEADKDVLELSMAERRQEFLAMDETQLEKLCTELSVDPLVKEVMVERLLAES